MTKFYQEDSEFEMVKDFSLQDLVEKHEACENSTKEALWLLATEVTNEAGFTTMYYYNSGLAECRNLFNLARKIPGAIDFLLKKGLIKRKVVKFDPRDIIIKYKGKQANIMFKGYDDCHLIYIDKDGYHIETGVNNQHHKDFSLPLKSGKLIEV